MYSSYLHQVFMCQIHVDHQSAKIGGSKKELENKQKLSHVGGRSDILKRPRAEVTLLRS